MTPKHLYLLLIAFVAVGVVSAQNEEDLQIPVENDNQFPPDKNSDTIDGSGDGVIEEPGDIDGSTTEAAPVPIEHIEFRISSDDTVAPSSEGDEKCPKPCVCRIEGVDFIVDCSGYDLTELPTPINEDATVLNLQRNKLTEIPKEISSLKKLKVLNADDNSIMNLVPGSVSELSQLVTLKLRNNRLIEYPHDLKNGFGLRELKELDLAGNDMRTGLTPDIFKKFDALRRIVLPSSTTSELAQDICNALPQILEEVCIETCEKELYSCKVGEGTMEDELIVFPGMLPSGTETEDDNTSEKSETDKFHDDTTTESPSNATSVEFSFRSAVNMQPSDTSLHSAIVEMPKDTTNTDQPIKVDATTSDTKTGGVDKSIIGLVVAGMVVIVAGITIKKNWSSIKNRFSSNSHSRTPNERNNGTNANGTAPEEVPLQDKSPV